VILFRHVAARFAWATLAAVAGLCGIHLVVDFVDQSKIFQGPGWPALVAEMYACKLPGAVSLLGPATLTFGASLALRGFVSTGEWTALQALGLRPRLFVGPLLLVSLAFGGAMFLAEDPVAVPAARRAAEITSRFGRHAPLWAYRSDAHWLGLSDGRVMQVGRADGAALEEVALYELEDGYHVRRRTDAARLEPLGDGRWRLVDVVTRDLGPGRYEERREAARVEAFGPELAGFGAGMGNPRLLPRESLPARIDVRARLGLPTRAWEVALHERRAYPFLGVPGAVVAMTRTRRGRERPNLTTALLDGLVVTAAMWLLTGLSRALGEGGHLAPAAAGWGPVALLAGWAALSLRKP
jgi:lipopolysaccharide export system permease protein